MLYKVGWCTTLFVELVGKKLKPNKDNLHFAQNMNAEQQFMLKGHTNMNAEKCSEKSFQNKRKTNLS